MLILVLAGRYGWIYCLWPDMPVGQGPPVCTPGCSRHQTASLNCWDVNYYPFLLNGKWKWLKLLLGTRFIPFSLNGNKLSLVVTLWNGNLWLKNIYEKSFNGPNSVHWEMVAATSGAIATAWGVDGWQHDQDELDSSRGVVSPCAPDRIPRFLKRPNC